MGDAELVFNNNEQQVQQKYKLKNTEVIYCWWIIFDGLARRYIQENRGHEASFTKLMTSKVLEPAYNFRDIQPNKINDNAMPVIVLLGFYILYTVWYGFSIMYIFEGLGISISAPVKKIEA